MFIDSKENIFVVNWDLGRRCTYACSYCPPFRSNKTSPLVSFDDMVKTMDFIHEYVMLYHHHKRYDSISLSITGGEPTVHPDLYRFAEYVTETYGDLYSTTITTNGAFSEKHRNLIKKHFNSGTISYHPEGDATPMVRANIFDLRWKVNVMFHKDYFQECIDLCDELSAEGIPYIPRRIGEEGGSNVQDSIANGWKQVYTDEQEQWFADYYGVKGSGRTCCGGRCMTTEEGDVTFIKDPNFNGWHCAINWYFLFINQENRGIWTHQTCGVNLDSEVNKLGTLDNVEPLLEATFDHLFIDNSIPIIKCPKTSCLCGVCIPKSTDHSFVAKRLPPQLTYTQTDNTPTERIKWVTAFTENNHD